MGSQIGFEPTIYSFIDSFIHVFNQIHFLSIWYVPPCLLKARGRQVAARNKVAIFNNGVPGKGDHHKMRRMES